MKPKPNRCATLEAVRAKIDGIDEELHRLMIERTELAREVWAAKDRSMAGLAAVRPAREAQMLRTFAKRHKGQMPLPVLWRIWRELIIANIRAQVPVAVHVAQKGRGDEVWDLARAHFGFETQMTRHEDPLNALGAAAEDGAIAVLPACSAALWGGELGAYENFGTFDALPQIAAPVLGAQIPQGPAAYLAGDVELEPTGADTSVVLVHAGEGTAVEAAAREGHTVNSCRPLGDGETTLLGVRGQEIAQRGRRRDVWGAVKIVVLGAHADTLYLV